MEEIKAIKNVSEFIDAVKLTFQHLKGPDELTSLWFRGESRSDYVTALCPKAYRIYGGPVDNPEFNDQIFNEWKGVEGNVKAAFLREAYRFMSRSQIPHDDWNQYFLMQHYGLKTRLLDWTENALVALFFAVNERISDSHAAKVWILAPHRLNAFTTKLACGISVSAIAIPDAVENPSAGIATKKGMIDINELCHKYLALDMSKYVLYPEQKNTRFFPLAIYPTLLDDRMANQQSCFTIFGDEVNGLLQAEENNNFLRHIVIEPNKKQAIQNELKWLGVSHKSITPDLDGLCKSIEEIYSYNHVLKRIK